MSPEDLQAIWLTLKLASITTAILLVISTPLAWWLAHSRSFWKGPLGALVNLPLVLPPTVLGFYLLLWMGPDGPIGHLTMALGLGRLPFTFWGIVVGSVLFSLPFAVQPIQNAFEAIGTRPLEAAATLRAGVLDRFFSVAGPIDEPTIAWGPCAKRVYTARLSSSHRPMVPSVKTPPDSPWPE